MRRPSIPPVLLGVIALVVGFTPLLFFISYSTVARLEPQPLIQKLLVGLGLFVSAVLFSVADRLGLLRTKSDLVELFPQPEAPPPPITARAFASAVKEGSALVLPASIATAAIDTLQEVGANEAADTAIDSVVETLTS